MTDVKKLMGEKNLLTPGDYSDMLHDRAQELSQEIFNHCAKTYRKTDGSAVVSVALLGVSVMMAREFSKGDCTKEHFLEKAAQLWETVVAVKV